MANTKFKTENGLLITGGDAQFANQVFVGNNSSRANLTVDGDLILINGDLIIDGDIVSLVPTAYTGDILAGIPGLNIGNNIIRFANGFFNNVFIYEGLYPVGNTIPLGNSTNRWVISANSLTISTTLSATGAVTFSNTLSATGAVTFSNTLSATGAVTFSNTLSATGAVSFSNTLNVTGATTLSNTLSVTNTATFSNNVTIAGFVNTATRFDVDGGFSGTTNGSSLTNIILRVGNSTSNVTLGSAAGLVIGSTVAGAGVKPSSNTIGNELGDADRRWILNANTGNFSGLLTATSGATFTGTVNASVAFNAGVIGTANGVSINTSAIAIGNSSVNAIITGQGFQPTSNVNFDNGTFFVDFPNNRVGINNVTPVASLTVTGATDISSYANIQGNANVGGTLGVDGATTLSGAATLSSTLDVTGAITSSGGVRPFSNTVGTNLGTAARRWVLNANTGNFTGAVTIAGATTLSSTLSVTSTAAFGNAISIANAVSFNPNMNMAITSDGRLGIGTTTPDTRFQVVGQANITGATALSNTLAVTGAVSFSNTLSVSGNVAINTAQFLSIGTISATTNGFSTSNNLISIGNTSVNVSISPSQVRANQGDTAAAPGYTWIGDLNTGMYRPGADVIGFTTGGVQRLQINNTITAVTTNTALKVPVGTTAERPTVDIGLIRYNTSLNQFEGYGTQWGTIGGGATGGGSDQVFYENSQTVTTNYTITTNKNAMSAGPVTINNGITVTVPTGARWVIV